MTRQKKMAECVFKRGFVTDSIDPQVDKVWKGGLMVARVPFGDLRNMWRRHHCRVLNPYGDSERCPYEPRDCALAFLDAIRVTVNARPRVPVGYFIKVAKGSGARRADEAVERRAAAARLRRTDVQPEPFREPSAAPTPSASTTPDQLRLGGSTPTGPGARRHGDRRVGEADEPDPSDSPERREDPGDARPDRGLPGRRDGPVSLGDLLGRVAPGPREVLGRPESPSGETSGEGAG